MNEVQGKRVLVIAGASGIGKRVAADLAAAGARVVLGGRDLDRVAGIAREIGDEVAAVRLDLSDEQTIVDAATHLGSVDHVVSLASAAARGPLSTLTRDVIDAAFDAKVIGPLLVAKHFAPHMPAGGAIVVFSGIAAWRPTREAAVVAVTNGAVAFLAEALAAEVAPVRVIAIAPGVIDSGLWDGPGKDALFARTAQTLPVQRVGSPADVSSAVQLALTNTFLTGTTLHIDGGGRLA